MYRVVETSETNSLSELNGNFSSISYLHLVSAKPNERNATSNRAKKEATKTAMFVFILSLIYFIIAFFQTWPQYTSYVSDCQYPYVGIHCDGKQIHT